MEQEDYQGSPDQKEVGWAQPCTLCMLSPGSHEGCHEVPPHARPRALHRAARHCARSCTSCMLCCRGWPHMPSWGQGRPGPQLCGRQVLLRGRTVSQELSSLWCRRSCGSLQGRWACRTPHLTTSLTQHSRLLKVSSHPGALLCLPRHCLHECRCVAESHNPVVCLSYTAGHGQPATAQSVQQQQEDRIELASNQLHRHI